MMVYSRMGGIILKDGFHLFLVDLTRKGQSGSYRQTS